MPPLEPEPEPEPPLPTEPVVLPEIGPAPRIHAKVARPWKSDLPARLGLSAGACDPERLVALHEAHPREEALYCAIAFAHEECGQLERAMEWAEKRVASFPDSIDARLAVAVRHFAPLVPDPTSGLPYNDELSVDQRLALAAQVIAEVDEVLALRPDVIALGLAAQAHVQQALAYESRNETPEQLLRTVLARRAMMDAWRRTKQRAELEGLPSCRERWVEGCWTDPPLTDAELRADAELEARLRKGG